MKKTIAIIVAALEAVSGAAPEAFVLFRKGWNELADGRRYLVDKEAFDLVYAYFQARGIDVVIDYEHQTITGGQAPAAGWITALEWDENRGIIAHVRWTEQAAQYIAKGEYRYFSPVFPFRSSDQRLTALHSVGLTNTPLTNNLDAIAAKLEAQNTQKEESMEFFKLLFAKLGLKDGAGAQDVMTAIDTIVAKAKEVKEVVAKEIVSVLGLQEGTDANTVVASILALKQKPEGMVSRQEFDTVVAKLAERDVQDAMTRWTRKMTPATKEQWLAVAKNDLPGFEAIMAKMPDVIPDRLPEHKEQAATVVDETTLNVAKFFGNSAEDLKKYAGGAQ